MNPQPAPRYDRLSQVFHWATAIIVTIAFILGPGGFGRLMRQGIDPATRSDIVWHESLGILVLVLTVLRLLWVAVRPAAPRFQMAGWMNLAARLVHIALWALLLAHCGCGHHWAYSGAGSSDCFGHCVWLVLSV